MIKRAAEFSKKDRKTDQKEKLRKQRAGTFLETHHINCIIKGDDSGMSSKKKAIRQRILESAQIPEDLSRGAVLLQITGREEVYIENFMGGFLEYTDCGILILGKQGRILIEGRYLQIPFYTSEEMKITGQIDQIRYL